MQKNNIEIIKKLDGVDVIRIHQVPTDGKGNLQFFEGNKDIPFAIKRIYFITDVKTGICRGAHAHKELKQVLFCPYGSVLLKLSNTKAEVEFLLDRPNVGIIIQQPTWRDMQWKVDNSVLCVVASDYYTETDYIRDYSEYERYMKGKIK